LYKVAVITDPELATGFRLAGVEVIEAINPEMAIQALRSLFSQDYGLIAVNDEFLLHLDRDTARLLLERVLPIVLPFPSVRVRSEKEAEAYMAELVKSCIGYYVKLR